MNEMNITSAQYLNNRAGESESIIATVDGKEVNVPLAVGNRHYDEIMRQVEEGTLTIEPADTPE